MGSRDNGTTAEPVVNRPQVAPRACKEANGIILGAAHAARTTGATIVDHLEGDTPWRDAKTTFEGMRALALLARNRDGVDELLQADQASVADEKAVARKKRKIQLLNELAALESADDA